MTRYVVVGAVLGAGILAVPLLLFDLTTPRDFEYLAAMTVCSPLYLPIGALGIGLGFSKAPILSAAIVSNTLVYATAGWWLWRARERSTLFRAGTVVLGLIALHIPTILIEIF